MHCMDEMIQKIREMKNPTVAGLDTRLEYIPDDFLREVLPGGVQGFDDAAQGIYAYNVRLIDALYDIVPAVKVQAAYYEMYGPSGNACFEKTMAYAKAKGMLVMADAKRNDIGATAQAYAAAYLGQTDVLGQKLRAYSSDFVTLNAYLGVDGIEPFVQAAQEGGRGMFILVKTSNPSSGQLQDMPLADGRMVYEAMADLVKTWGETTLGKEGYSSVGAVVGATYPAQGTQLRKRMPQTFFLVPGYGAQGATGADLAGCFDAQGHGAIVNASRSILCAWKKQEGVDLATAARTEALRMREDIATALHEAGKDIR